ncbi:PilZ domain-containing protein [Aestuariibacter sp. A3R04]|uniref:PilZ domain-containing protein n=1 Tax=Aestuariibacter sp. A3R04 TaxID=2841571 RepID=UPI001C083A82|nr:PilZ domain-containing protein [Aestuariibacter sp. A3R04]MBU3023125.1 PilZ domain-containing protein [Aestuariibacter sp. A3R04]
MSIDKVDRKYKRVPLTQETTPSEMQAKGVPAELLRHSIFNYSICKAVLKDISVGGAGALVPASKKIPNKVRVLIADKITLKAKVAYRNTVNDELIFLGLDWSNESEKKFNEMIKLVRQLSFQNAGYGVQRQSKPRT